ncbi:hypothetical protein C1H46_032443 [Malus baccata]|uniref:Uncharacterized protein n=1 Tax=Malus baccata TaxID=106549 RepID=A0A540L695_MALBA|nr:hypothetical protein C1H46_032443 [Malus baccata]
MGYEREPSTCGEGGRKRSCGLQNHDDRRRRSSEGLMSPLAMVKMEDAKFYLMEVVKEDMKRRLKNTNMKPPSHSSYLRLQVLCQIFYDADEKLHVLDELSISDLKSFIPELCSQLYCQVEQETGIESIRLKALIDLFDEIVEPLFNQLR